LKAQGFWPASLSVVAAPWKLEITAKAAIRDKGLKDKKKPVLTVMQDFLFQLCRVPQRLNQFP